MAVVRTDLGGTVPTQAGNTVINFEHISDLHVLDAASPARAEWVELESADPLYRPLLHMHRPYDALTAHALLAHVDSIRDRDRNNPIDLVVSTGDNIDNGQRNELDTYLAIVCGGTARLSAAGSAQDPSTRAFPEPWPYWSPDGGVSDGWRDLGYPVVDDFVARAGEPLVSRGFGVPWASVPGNHDLLRQGTALDNVAIGALAVGNAKSLRRPDGFAPADPLSLFLDEPEAFSMGRPHTIEADAGRRAVDRREWVEAHRAAGALAFTQTNVDDATVDAVIDTEHVRFVLLDTNHPDGDFDGSVGTGQLAWLDEQLAEVDRDNDRLAILMSHHGTDTLTNDRGHRKDRRVGPAIHAIVHRHPSAVAWLVGHRHINRIDPRPGPSGGYWEITTCSIIDWPSETRAIEVRRHGDDSLELVCTMHGHHAEASSLAALHLDLARRFTPPRAAAKMAGRDLDRDVRLVLPARRA